MIGILQRLRPKLALEIGTYKGGSLQVISEFSEQVISVDIDPRVENELAGRFANVAFRTGPSSDLLPNIVNEFNDSGKAPSFILVDGAHSTDGVRQDIACILQIRPTTTTVVLMHDSFNPGCRKGILQAPWLDCPYVHSIDLDFVAGGFFDKDYDTGKAGSMWAGFACAILQPEIRQGPLEIIQSGQSVFEAVRGISVYAQQGRQKSSIPVRIYRRCRSWWAGL